MSDGATVQIEGASKRCLPSSLLNGRVLGLTSKCDEVFHAENVEKSSTFGKKACCDVLNIRRVTREASCHVMSDAYDKQTVGQRLSLLRRAYGFGLRPFARHMDVDHTKLNHWEKGKHYPDFPFISALTARFGVTSDWLFFGVSRGLSVEVVERLRAAEKLGVEPAEETTPEAQTT